MEFHTELRLLIKDYIKRREGVFSLVTPSFQKSYSARYLFKLIR